MTIQLLHLEGPMPAYEKESWRKLSIWVTLISFSKAAAQGPGLLHKGQQSCEERSLICLLCSPAQAPKRT